MPDILNKITSGINKGVATVGANSKAMLEKAKINTVINNLENERKQLTQLLGTKIYEMHKSGEITIDDAIQNFLIEIDKRVELIAQQQEQLRRIEAEVSLVTSGTGPVIQGGAACACRHINNEGVKFCAKCGSPQRPKPAVTMPQPPIPKTGIACACGHVNSEVVKFCAKCGSPQQQNGESASEAEEPAAAAAEEPPFYVAPQPESSAPQVGFVCTCGYTNPEGMKFCVNCGCSQQTSLEYHAVVEEVAIPAGLVCACGNANPEGMKFCVSCGNQL